MGELCTALGTDNLPSALHPHSFFRPEGQVRTMELAVVLGLAFAGYKLASRTPLGRLAVADAAEADDGSPSALKERWESAKQPLRSGVFANKWLVDDPVPYFGSGAAQHTSDTHKDLKLALFTGEPRNGVAPQGFRASKAAFEAPQIWKPEETASSTPLGFSGAATAATTTADMAARVQVPQLHNNVNPAGAPQVVAPINDPLLRAMPINPSTKMPGLLPGPTSAGYSSSSGQPAARPPPPRAVAMESQTAARAAPLPVLNQAAHISTHAPAGQPLATRQRQEPANRPQPQELRGVAYAPGMAAAAAKTMAIETVVVQRATKRQELQQPGQLAYGASSLGTGHASATASAPTRRQAATTGPQLGTMCVVPAQSSERLAFVASSRALGGSAALNPSAQSGFAAASSAPAPRHGTDNPWSPKRQQLLGAMAMGQARALPSTASAPPSHELPPRRTPPGTSQPSATRLFPVAANPDVLKHSSMQTLKGEGCSLIREGAATRLPINATAPSGAWDLRGRKQAVEAATPLVQARALVGHPPMATTATPSSRADQPSARQPAPARALATTEGSPPIGEMTTARRAAGQGAEHAIQQRVMAASKVPETPQATVARKVTSSPQPWAPAGPLLASTVPLHLGPASQATARAPSPLEADDQSRMLVSAGSHIPAPPAGVPPQEQPRVRPVPTAPLPQPQRPLPLQGDAVPSSTGALSSFPKIGGTEAGVPHLQPLAQVRPEVQAGAPEVTTVPKRAGA